MVEDWEGRAGLRVGAAAVALPTPLRLARCEGVAVGHCEAEPVVEVCREGERETLPVEEREALLLGVRLGSCASPAAMQADCARYVTLQGVGTTVPSRGQK